MKRQSIQVFCAFEDLMRQPDECRSISEALISWDFSMCDSHMGVNVSG